MSHGLGNSYPLNGGAASRAIMSLLPDDEIDRILDLPAVPFRRADPLAPGAIDLAGPSDRMMPELLDRALPHMRATAQRIMEVNVGSSFSADRRANSVQLRGRSGDNAR